MPRPRQHKALWEGREAGCDLTPSDRRYSPDLCASSHSSARCCVFHVAFFVHVCACVRDKKGTLSHGEQSLLWSEGVLIPINSVPNAEITQRNTP